MGKIIFGMIQTISVPFLVIIGNYVITLLNIKNEGVLGFIGVFGFCSLGFMLFIGFNLVVQGYREKFGMFKNL